MLVKKVSLILLLSMVFTFLQPPRIISADVGFQIRPPFYGDFKLTSYFDHTNPTGTRDYSPITIYTGDTSPDGDPYYYSAHAGIDWGMSEGTLVLAVADGIVAHVGDEGLRTGFGKYVRVDHNNGYISLYAHLSNVLVSVGNSVRAGDLLGYSGNTGASTGPHLHLQIYLGPVAIPTYSTDPFGWRGSDPDPLIDYGGPGAGHQASCLWEAFHKMRFLAMIRSLKMAVGIFIRQEAGM